MQKAASLIGLILVVFLATGCGDNSSTESSTANIESYCDGVYVNIASDSQGSYLFLRNENDWPVDVEIETSESSSRIYLQPSQEYTMAVSTETGYLYLAVGGYEYKITF